MLDEEKPVPTGAALRRQPSAARGATGRLADGFGDGPYAPPRLVYPRRPRRGGSIRMAPAAAPPAAAGGRRSDRSDPGPRRSRKDDAGKSAGVVGCAPGAIHLPRRVAGVAPRDASAPRLRRQARRSAREADRQSLAHPPPAADGSPRPPRPLHS